MLASVSFNKSLLGASEMATDDLVGGEILYRDLLV